MTVVKNVMKRLSGQLAQVCLFSRVILSARSSPSSNSTWTRACRLRHQQRRRHAFSGHVADHHGDAAVGERDEVVIIAAHGARRNRPSGDIQACNLGGAFGSRPYWISAACCISLAMARSVSSISFSRACSMRMAATLAITVSRFRSSRVNSRIRCGEST